jgi:hypothetical protein
MKVILSRKGFDSSYGGYPSPILPSGEMVSLPIPLEDDIKYSDLSTDGSTYYDLMKDLRPTIKRKGEWIPLDQESKCHLDPDIHRGSIRRGHDWKPCFGQIGAAQSHLENQHVSEDDLFLFFGWFRKTRYHNGKLEFDPNERDFHSFFGYLQVGEITKVNRGSDVPKWLAYHPHTSGWRLDKETNTTYIARDRSSWNESLSGTGRFMFNDRLVLTKKELSRSKWNLPNCFRDAEISCHKDPWKDGYFQSLPRGQEFVIRDNAKIEEWAKGIVEGSQIDS